MSACGLCSYSGKPENENNLQKHRFKIVDIAKNENITGKVLKIIFMYGIVRASENKHKKTFSMKKGGSEDEGSCVAWSGQLSQQL